MNWLRVDAGIGDHPKFKMLGVLLKRDRAHSYVIDLWGWVARYHPTGDISDVHDLEIAQACHWTDDPSAFIDALVQCRIIDNDNDGTRTVHDWAEHQGKLIERASLARQRSREWRERIKAERNGHEQERTTNRNERIRSVLRTDVRTNDTNDTNEQTNKRTVTKKEQARPTTADVDAYILERGYSGFTGQEFVDYYTANGWRVGRNPMKDWQAAVRNWASREKKQHKSTFGGTAAVHDPNKPCQICGGPWPCKTCYPEA